MDVLGAISGDLGAIALKSCEGAMNAIYYRLVQFVVVFEQFESNSD